MIGTYERVVEVLREAQTVAVTGHLRPDADAIGSVMALTLALRKMGKTVTAHVGQAHDFSANLRTIPGAHEVQPSTSLPAEADLIVAVDCGSIDRTGPLAQEFATRRSVVIDHHASNPGFGTENLVAPAESTTVILRQIIEMLGVDLDRDIAHALYAGLMTDTGSFRWGTERMHTLAAELMEYGLDPRQIAVDLLDLTTSSSLQMIGRVLSGLQVRAVGNHTAAILIADIEAIGGQPEGAVESLVDFVRALEGTDVGVVFKEQSQAVWAVSLRSSSIDVSELALKLGGGGHVPAAGYMTVGPREAIVAEFLAVLGATP